MSSDRDSHVRSSSERGNSARSSRSADAYRSIAESEDVETADRIIAAEKLGRFDRASTVRILGGLAADDGLYDVDRWNAAEALSRVDPAAAAEAFYDIANDDAVDPASRMAAADRVADLEV